MSRIGWSRTSRSRTACAVVWTAVFALLFTLFASALPARLGVSSALAAPSALQKAQADLAQAKKELKALQAKLDKLAKQQVDAENDLENTKIKIEKVEARISRAEDDLAGLKRQLAGRLAEIYKSRGSEAANMLSVVFAGDDVSIGEVIKRLSMVSRVAQADADLIAKVKERLEELADLKADLSSQKAAEQKKNAKYLAAQEATLASLEASKDDYNRLRSRVARLQEEARRAEEARQAAEAAKKKAAEAAAAAKKKAAASAASQTASVGADWVFPVAGPNSFSSTFGAPRSGGRTHKGADIFTARNTPIVAVVDGVIRSTSPVERGLGGITIHLTGSDGNVYYYAHLASIKSGIRAGVRVTAGQVIGYAGNTGNARTTPVHLHFEIRPNGGAAIDPYRTLVKYR